MFGPREPDSVETVATRTQLWYAIAAKYPALKRYVAELATMPDNKLSMVETIGTLADKNWSGAVVDALGDSLDEKIRAIVREELAKAGN
jgi:hypothetical protein